jgi:hypothetical protein
MTEDEKIFKTELAADVQPKSYELKVISQHRNEDVNRNF